jgi:transcriptional regulator
MAAAAASFLSGTLDLIVLQLLGEQPTNGFDLMKRIQATSRDVLSVPTGSLYPALYRLEQRGLIRAAWDETDQGRRAKVYSLTRTGRKHLAEQREAWAQFAGALHAILSTT